MPGAPWGRCRRGRACGTQSGEVRAISWARTHRGEKPKRSTRTRPRASRKATASRAICSTVSRGRRGAAVAPCRPPGRGPQPPGRTPPHSRHRRVVPRALLARRLPSVDHPWGRVWAAVAALSFLGARPSRARSGSGSRPPDDGRARAGCRTHRKRFHPWTHGVVHLDGRRRIHPGGCGRRQDGSLRSPVSNPGHRVTP